MQMNLVLKILITQLLFCTVIVLTISAMRLFDNNSFERFKEAYTEYLRYDTSVSLVTEGK